MTGDGVRGRIPVASIIGAVVGLVVGVGIGYFGRAPLMGDTVFGYVFIPLLVGVIAFIVLVGWAVRRPTASAVAAPVAFGVAALVGVVIAPPSPGSAVTVPATVTIGTPADPLAYFSGSAECQWYDGDTVVEDIAGFEALLSDPAALAALDLPGPASADRVHLGMGASIGPVLGLEYAGGAESYSGSFSPLELVDLGPGARTGTAAAGDAVIIIWECSRGPGS